MFKLYEWESSESINQQIQKINNSINEVYKKIENTIYDQQKIVKKRTEDINIFHYIPHRTINDIIDKIDKDRWKVMNPDMTYLDLFPKTEVADCFSSMIKSGLKGNCEGRTVLNDLIEYQGFLDKTGFMKKIYDQNRAMVKNTKELETHLRHLFIEKHSLANLSNKFFKININKRKFKDSEKVSKDEGKKLVVQLNDDVIDLILEYLPGYYLSLIHI